MTTGTTVARSHEARSYLDRVGAALADLPEEERADLLDELGTHVDEIAAEGTSSLESRLGTPEAYAAELRAAAGLPPARARGRAVVEALARLRVHRRSPAMTGPEEFLRSIRPAWWVLRAWVVVALLTWYAQPHWLQSLVVVPDVGPDGLSILALLAAVVASVQLGRRELRTATATWLIASLNLVAALGLWPVLLTLNEAVHYGAYNDYGPRLARNPELPREGVFASGRQVTNLFVYDATGRALSDVRIYDQKGRPLDIGVAVEAREVTVDADGRAVPNAYPYRYFEPSVSGVAPAAAGSASMVVPPLLGVPTGSPAPTASATPSPSPTGGKR
jgi:hypothetical protein